MKAPKSWILEYVDVPDGTTTDELTARLTLTGLKLEAIESAGADISGPLVVGRVLTMEPEPQKNGKTINWCTVDVGDANGTGEPLIQALERPSLLIMRRSTHSSSASRSCSANQRAAGLSLATAKHAVISALSQPGLTRLASARLPKHRLSASRAIDLPAPVSPVIAVIPLRNSISSDLTIAK